MYEIVYTCLFDEWSEWYTSGLFVGLLCICEVMGLEIYISLVGLD